MGLECEVIERAAAERMGMNSYLSVAQGSQQPPKFIVLRYRGGRGRRSIGLVGKGITFDTGGISLKPPANMERMKGDMSGAAAVIGAIGAIARLEPAVNVTAIAPCTENMPSGTATKPGDVFYAMDGQTIEVINTDAEGRLVLADALAYARSQGCTPLVDVATLTGAMAIALGNVRVGVFANNDRLYADLERAASASGEKLWRFPLDDEYDEQIRSDVADIKNTGGRGAGSITAAKFLHRFAGRHPVGALRHRRRDGRRPRPPECWSRATPAPRRARSSTTPSTARAEARHGGTQAGGAQGAARRPRGRARPARAASRCHASSRGRPGRSAPSCSSRGGTVEWSRPPRVCPISASERCASSRIRYIASCRG